MRLRHYGTLDIVHNIIVKNLAEKTVGEQLHHKTHTIQDKNHNKNINNSISPSGSQQQMKVNRQNIELTSFLVHPVQCPTNSL